MWDPQKSIRFQELRQREVAKTLTEAEKSELSLLTHDLEAAEATYLAPATQYLKRERQFVESQNNALEELVRRKENLARRLHDFLSETQAERSAIEHDLALALANGQRSDSDQ